MTLLTLVPFLLQQATERKANPMMSFIMIIGLFAIMYFILLRPQIKQQKETKKMVEALKVGDKIITTGGIWGEIDSVDRDRVRLKIADKMKVMISRSAVAGHQPDPSEPKEEEKK